MLICNTGPIPLRKVDVIDDIRGAPVPYRYRRSDTPSIYGPPKLLLASAGWGASGWASSDVMEILKSVSRFWNRQAVVIGGTEHR